ncbi:hypothetical protein H9N28_00650 [Rhodobacter capsulatus]|uniref:hypothetical protein n=1 Tax=Rhodobacter capsulatus TaxID=1061 RepID=UPI001364A574|nr:hypothetical protein [Rhodobacter capsulatus]QNR63386.1 hypothetical protein H9N28_00650 [Rhodobacter capsulatus]
MGEAVSKDDDFAGGWRGSARGISIKIRALIAEDARAALDAMLTDARKEGRVASRGA